MKYYLKKLILLPLCLLLTGCARSSAASAALFQINETVDASYLLSTEEVTRETEDLKNKYQYDTAVTDCGGEILSELRDGTWHVSEEGEKIYGLISEITNNGIVGPNIRYAVNLDTELTQDCIEILKENNLDGCIIVSDLHGRIQAIADYTGTLEYYSGGEFKISEDHEKFDLLLETDQINQNYILHHESGAEDEIIPFDEMYIGHTGRTYHSDGVYYGSTAKLMSATVLMDVGMSFTDTPYYDAGVINYGYHKNIYNHNYPDSMYPAYHTMKTSLINSYNTFFAAGYAGILTGSSFYYDFGVKLNETLEKINPENGFLTIARIMNKYFGFNEFGSQKAGYIYPCDWMDLRQPSLKAIDTSRENEKDREFLIARMAIGMCSDGQMIDGQPTGNYFDASPLFLNAVTGAVASGDMYRLNIKSDSLETKLKDMEYRNSDTEDSSEDALPEDTQSFEALTGTEIQTIPLSYREALWSGMKAIMPYEYNGYTAYVKTGTADDGTSFRRFLLTGFVTQDEEPNDIRPPEGWAVTLYIHNGTELSSEFASGYTDVYKQILRLVIKGGESES